MAVKSVIKSKSLAPPSAAGDYYRLLCMTGKNKGTVYYLNSNRVVLGRSEQADITIWDQKSSREHCELVKHGDTYVMTDLDSQNGVIINDLEVTQHRLKDGDKIIIGQTVYKFNKINILPPAVLDSDEDDEEEEDEEIEEASNTKKKKKVKEDDPAAKRKRLIIIGAVVTLLLLFMVDDDGGGDDEETGRSGQQSFTLDQESRSALDVNRNEDPEITAQVEVHIHRGLRELREKNFFRAIHEFRMALVLSPNHGSASYYLSKAEQGLDSEVEIFFERARREIEALKYSEAITSYCSIIRLLQSHPSDQRFIDAQNSLELVREQMGARASEHRCIEE